MILSNIIQHRLNVLWSRLQTRYWEKDISQLDLDEKCMSVLEDIEKIPHRTIQKYLTFMKLNANASKIATGIMNWKLCPGIDYHGTSKSDIAKDFASDTHQWHPDTLKVLLSNFGSK